MPKLSKETMRFENKIVFISGGSKGIGLAAAKGFLSEKAKVIICSRTKENIENAINELGEFGGEVYGEVGDLTNEHVVIGIFKKINKTFGGIDILVNSAGVSKAAKIEDISQKEWHYILDNNLTNCFFTCKHVLKYMKKKRNGKIVNVSSIAGRFRSKLAGVHYTCAKAAVIALTKQLANEVGRYNININTVCPGQTKTEMLLPFLDGDSENILKESIPLGYIALPEQQAAVIMFLASEQANYITGAIVDVNGGQL